MKRILTFIFLLVAGWAVSIPASAQNLNMSLDGDVRHCPSEDLDASSYYKLLDDSDNVCALIKVTVTNDLHNPLALETGGLKVVKRQEQENGEIWFWIPYQVKNLIFSCKGFKTMAPVPVRLQEGKTYRLTLRTDAQMHTVSNATVSFNFLKMNISPVEATVSIGTTPDCSMDTQYVTDGFFSYQLNYGTYYYRIENPYYETLTGKVTVSENMSELPLRLTPAYSYLDLRSEPSGATAFVDGEYVGKTPVKTTKRYKRGAVTVRMQKEEYSTISETIQVVGNGGDQLVNLSLNAQFANVTCKSEDPKAEIYVDNVYRGVGSWTGHLSSTMNHVLEARRASHQSQSISFSVNSGENVTKQVGAPVPLYGILSLETNPGNCSVTINGEDVGRSPIVKQLLIGEHQITIRKDGYLAQQFSINLTHNQRLNVNRTLEKGRLIADVTIRTKAGATVYANNEYLGVATNGTWTGKLQEGKYEITAELAEHITSATQYEIVGKGPISIVVPDPVRKTGGVNISSKSGAQIYVKASNADQYSFMGAAPYKSQSFPTGSYKAYATKKGYYDSEVESFRVTENSMTNLDLSLRKKRWINSSTLFDDEHFFELVYGAGFRTKVDDAAEWYNPVYFSDNFLGLNYGYNANRWGFQGTLMYGLDEGEFALTAGPLLRLNDYGIDWQFYLGAGLMTSESLGTMWLGDAALRMNLNDTNEDESFAWASMSLGCKFNDKIIVPNLGLSLFPGLLTTEDQEMDDFSKMNVDFLTGYNAGYDVFAVGFSVSYCYTRLGLYGSMMWDQDGYGSYVAGPVFRLSDDIMNDFDWQAYVGAGWVSDDWGFDLGLRVDIPCETYVGLADFSLGCQIGLDGTVMPYLGMSWTIALCGGAALAAVMAY